MTDFILRRLHDYGGSFYMLVRKDGAIVVEAPEEQEPAPEPREARLRLFTSAEDARGYRSSCGFAANATVGKTTLVALWGVLDKLDEVSQNHFKCPIAVEVSVLDPSGAVVCIDVLHSSLRPAD